MKALKVSYIWTPGMGYVKNSLIFNLIQNLVNREVVFSKPSKADLLFIGCYNLDTIFNRIAKAICRRLCSSKLKNLVENYQEFNLLKKSQQIKIFLPTENVRHDQIKAQFSISSNLGVNDENHLRLPVWKENIDWSKEGIVRNISFFYKNKKYNHENILRFGSYYNLDELIQPQGDYFMHKKNFCIFTTFLSEPRKTMFNEFSKNFIVHGYGKYFNVNLKNHNQSNFTKKEIMKNYAFNLCPHNAIYPGYYEEKVPEAFLSKCLPITWADQNIDYDFNPRAFVNLNNHIKDNFNEIIYLLKQREFLQKFVDEPLILSKPNLEKEIKFAKKIISCL
jgi:hypothetical protein